MNPILRRMAIACGLSVMSVAVNATQLTYWYEISNAQNIQATLGDVQTAGLPGWGKVVVDDDLAGTIQAAGGMLTMDQINFLAGKVFIFSQLCGDTSVTNGGLTCTVGGTGVPIGSDTNLIGDQAINEFGFNDGALSASNILFPNLSLIDPSLPNLADLFEYKGSAQMDGFGNFDHTILRTGSGGTNNLAFAIVGIEGDVAGDYVNESNKGFLFAAKPASGSVGQQGAFIAVVPVPAAAWMFASALLGLAGIARRRTA